MMGPCSLRPNLARPGHGAGRNERTHVPAPVGLALDVTHQQKKHNITSGEAPK